MVDDIRVAGRYAAFISYSHKDASAARRLHARLEHYRIPKRLVGTLGEHGPVPARLTPIFRDRDDLPAAGDLSEKVRTALAASDHLVVLCSPHAASSPWVAREIQAFRELHPGRPVFAAIIEGEPGDCFPAVLGGVATDGATIEPLAADLRRVGDGQRLGFLKLVAGLTGLDLDALVQRDAARQIRRVTAVTLVSVIAMLVMAVLTIFAIDARREAERQRIEAERQRGEAEGLVDFMQTTLRAKLKGVGSLEVMGIVNERAIAYYGDEQALGTLPDDSLERRARSLHAMGEDEVTRGDMARALASFREARRITAATLSRHPNDARAIFAHAQSEYWIGRVHEVKREWPAAQQQYTRYAEGGKRLIAIAPHNPEYMMERGWGELNLAHVQLSGAKDPVAAEKLTRRAIIWFERAAHASTDNAAALREEANAYADLADSFYVRNHWQESLGARQRQYAINLRLFRADPTDADRVYVLALSERAVAKVSGKLTAGTTDRPLLMAAYGRSQWLLHRAPDNAEWLLFKLRVECDLLDNHATSGRIGAAEIRHRISAGAAKLRAKGNPRISEISSCLTNLNRS